MASVPGAYRLELDNWNTTRLLFQWAAFHSFPQDYNAVLADEQDKFLADREHSNGASKGTLRRKLQALLSRPKARLFPPDVVNSSHPEYSATFMTALTHAATVDPDGRHRLWATKVIPFVKDVTDETATGPADLEAWNDALKRVRVLPSFSSEVFIDVPVETTTSSEAPPISPETTLVKIQDVVELIVPILGATQTELSQARDLEEVRRIAKAGFTEVEDAMNDIGDLLQKAQPR